MSILELKSLTKSYQNNKVIDNLDIVIYAPKIFGLIGKNGAGKTTIINCIADLIEFDSGEIKIFQKDISKDSISVKKEIGFLFENSENLFNDLRVEEHLDIIGEIYGVPRKVRTERIEELILYFELRDDSGKMIHSLSKGMKKKLILASILLYLPNLIILDEPFDGLDTLTVIKVKKLIKLLKEKGKTILITSHILSYIEDLADEVAIINKGKIVYQSETKDIRSKIKNEVTKETYQSLEEIFIDLTASKEENENTLSWL